MSPEQTGRMNRSIDYRTDIYSLGITFYEILTNKLPFMTSDTMELIYCHLAIKPTLPSEIINGLPMAISNIVMKCIAKNAEDRYNSASGLLYDLQHCLNQLDNKSEIYPFELGQNDEPLRFAKNIVI